MTNRLSIIIPVYNSASYIERCVKSIMTQRVSHWCFELILINDGSTDKSDAVCQRLSEQYKEIIYCTQINKGTSAARNTGLDIATGDYVWFVDSDDSIASDAIIPIMHVLEDEYPEILAFNYCHETNRGFEEIKCISSEINEPVGDYLLANKSLYLWNKVYRKDILKGVRFLEGTKNIEDFLFNIEVMSGIDTVLCIPLCGYCYNTCNQNSTSRSLSKRNLIKLSQDSFLVHDRLSLVANDSERHSAVIRKLQSFSIAGHLFSLFRFYNLRHVHRALERYSALKLYPFSYTDNMKANILIWMLNRNSIRKLISVLSK